MQNNEPLISIIIPVFNAQKYIEETILSVIGQTYRNWELIVVDDCSKDDSVIIVQRMMVSDSRIQLIESEENFGGPAKPRNMGMQVSNGQYIAFLDNDDVWVKDKLERQINCFLLNDNIDIVHTRAYTINNQGVETGVFNNQRVFNILKILFKEKYVLFFSNNVNINTVLMKSTVNKKFREDKNVVTIEDWMFWLDNKLNEKNFFLMKDELAYYRISEYSLSSKSGNKIYKKTYYMYALYLIEMKISTPLYTALFVKNTINLIVGKLKNLSGN